MIKKNFVILLLFVVGCSKEIPDVIGSWYGISKIDPKISYVWTFYESKFNMIITTRERKAIDKGMFQINTKTSPKEIDIVNDSSVKLKAIYKKEGNKLTIAIGYNGIRPSSFEEKDGVSIYIMNKQ